MRDKLDGRTCIYFLTSRISIIVVVSCPSISIIPCAFVLRLSYHFIVAIVLSCVCCFLLFVVSASVSVFPFLKYFAMLSNLSFYQKQPLYLYKGKGKICVHSIPILHL